ncbi:hypothetical protein DFH11DRAFT_1579573 [Phellopilus nigrolimitatus]|nr:hypothetical protein DFH11DRAFT_1579573 [Phellopilus nigrolimitatus]
MWTRRVSALNTERSNLPADAQLRTRLRVHETQFMATQSERIPKHERSPSPVLSRPIKEGVKWYSPIPFSCTKKSGNWEAERKKWSEQESEELHKKGLTVTRIRFRDDGLTLDWESPVPVWPDTLLPANQEESQNPSPLLIENETPIQGVIQSLPDEEAEELNRQACELEDMAVDFLKRYAETFDTDRSALASAYASDASFSYCVHDFFSLNMLAAHFTISGVQRFVARKGSRNLLNLEKTQYSKNLHKGRVEIVPALLALGPHKFCSSSPTDVNWNVLAVQLGDTPHVFLTSHGYLTEEKAGRENRLSFDQCFILQKAEYSDVDGASSGLWPMVAVCHQLTIRDMTTRVQATS